MREICIAGHPMVEGNIRLQRRKGGDKSTHWVCLTCARIQQRDIRAAAKAARAGMTKPALPEFNARTVENFWSKVDKTETCWLWRGAVDALGYGRIFVKKFPFHWMLKTHRVAWILTNGPIPDGLVIDHLCRTKACVNPSHFELVTPAENSRRAIYTRLGEPYPWDDNLQPVAHHGDHRTEEHDEREGERG